MDRELYEKKLQARLYYYQITQTTKIYASKLINRYKDCVYCGEPLDENNYSVEHITNPNSPSKEDFIAAAKIPNNIVLCCRNCNPSKGKKTLEEWLENLKKGKTDLPKEKTDKIKDRVSHLISEQ